tara:strand:- start:2042 stop:3010 length:969 start_codon:yes stop_codon:yes gene_type:complete
MYLHVIQMSLQKLVTYAIFLGIIVILGEWRKELLETNGNPETMAYREIVEKHMFGSGTSLQGKIPIWIPIEHTVNARYWPSFGSRLTRRVNKPYLSLCIETIVKNAGPDYEVVIVDDASYGVLIPGWDINIGMVAEPMKNNIRTLALWRVLFYYGGLLCPPSTICIKRMSTLANIATTQLFSVEQVATACSNNLYQANPRFIGCSREHAGMLTMITELESLLSSDSTDELVFTGGIQSIMAQCKDISVINGKLVGSKCAMGSPATVDNLFEGVDFTPKMICLVLPEREIDTRVKYGWFPRMNKNQVMSSSVPFVSVIKQALR